MNKGDYYMSNAAGSQDKLSPMAMAAIALAIFSMHFGASCMLWPTTWGRNAGTAWPLAFAGFFISGIILPWLGYLAVSKGGGPLYTLTSLVGRKFTFLVGGLTVAALGPFFAVPRMSAAAWDAFGRSTGLEFSESAFVFSILFQFVFYAVTYWFMYKESIIIDKLSKYLVPALILTEFFLITYAIINPMGPQAGPNYEGNVIARGFVDGYQTLDLTCALMFASIIIADIKRRLGNDTPKLNYYLVLTGLLGFLFMACIQCGEMYRGSTASVTLPDVNYAKLSMTMVMEQIGGVVTVFFNLCLILACLTTAIGILGGTASFMASAAEGRLKFATACLICCVLSMFTGIVGLDTIVKLFSPVMSFMYPPCIALTLCLCFATPYIGGLRGACWGTAIYGALDAARLWMNMASGTSDSMGFFLMIPGVHDGLGFAWFMVVGWLIGHFVIWKNERFILDPNKQADLPQY